MSTTDSVRAGRDAAGMMSRRDALRLLGGAAALWPLAAKGWSDEAGQRTDSVRWFQNARFGLFIHFGLYSQLEHGEWVMLKEKVPLEQYEQLKMTFRPDRFNANEIADMAAGAGMRYITLTAKHHEGFCLFRTRQTSYSSADSPARRDLVEELAESCSKKKLKLFLYYSMGADWHHPYFCDPSAGWNFYRPAYAVKPAQYRWKKDADFTGYIDYAHEQLRELLTQYGALGGIWFDPLMGYYARPDLFPLDKTYALIRKLQPDCLISFKQGATGAEDFAAPERKVAGIQTYDSIAPERRANAHQVAEHAWSRNRAKPLEICDTLQPGTWGYDRRDDGKHRTTSEVIAMLKSAREQNANLLLNTGPLPDGSIHPDDVVTLREVGRKWNTEKTEGETNSE